MWLQSIVCSVADSEAVRWLGRNIALLWGILGWALAVGDIFGKGTSLVNLFRRYIYPRSIDIPDRDLARLRNARFGQEMLYPKKWLRHYVQNGDGSVFTDPANASVEIRTYGSHFSGSGCVNPDDMERETVDNYVGYLSQTSHVGCRFTPHSIKTTIMPEVEFDLPREEMTRGFRSTLRSSDGVTSLEFVVKSQGVWYHLNCSAPRKLFPRYVALFEHILGSFEIVHRYRFG